MVKEIKEEMINLQKKVIKELGTETDVLMATFNDGHCGAIMRGASNNIAHSLFALIHDKDNKLSLDLYRTIKLVVLNIINNESPYAMDLLQSILNAPGPVDKSEKPKKGDKAMLVQMNKKNEQN